VRFWSARAVCQAVRDKSISVAEYTEELIAACRDNQALNAFIALDETRARTLAKAKDAASATGLLHGLPIGIKDAIGTNDLPTTAGTNALRGHRPKQNANVVDRLLESDAFVFAKLNQHEMSFGITSNNAAFGPVRNPYDLERIPGGSSGGAGAAVASGMVPAAIGTDTGGSVRIPAALCGLVGFRPSIGRYSQQGIVPISNTRDTAGPLCRSVDDAAFIDAAISGDADELENIAIGDLRIGLPANHFFDNLHGGTAAVISTALDCLRAAGCKFTEVEMTGIEAPADACGFPIAIYETKRELTRYLSETAANGPSFEQLVAEIASPDVKAFLSGMLAPEYDDLAEIYRDAIDHKRPNLQKHLSGCFADNRLDAFIFPTTILPAARIGEDESVELNGQIVPLFPTLVHNTDPGSTAGIPGVTIPAGLTQQGLPVGLGIDGPFGSDRRLLAIAKTLEAALPPMPRAPTAL